MGFQPWWSEGTHFDRSTSQGGVDALVDWRILAGSCGIVYPAASTFSAEAAVAGGVGEDSDPLTSSTALQSWRRRKLAVVRAATYPARRRKS